MKAATLMIALMTFVSITAQAAEQGWCRLTVTRNRVQIHQETRFDVARVQDLKLTVAGKAVKIQAEAGSRAIIFRAKPSLAGVSAEASGVNSIFLTLKKGGEELVVRCERIGG